MNNVPSGRGVPVPMDRPQPSRTTDKAIEAIHPSERAIAPGLQTAGYMPTQLSSRTSAAVSNPASRTPFNNIQTETPVTDDECFAGGFQDSMGNLSTFPH